MRLKAGLASLVATDAAFSAASGAQPCPAHPLLGCTRHPTRRRSLFGGGAVISRGTQPVIAMYYDDGPQRPAGCNVLLPNIEKHGTSRRYGRHSYASAPNSVPRRRHQGVPVGRAGHGFLHTVVAVGSGRKPCRATLG